MLKVTSLVKQKKDSTEDFIMSQIETLEQNIRKLSPRELTAFRAWFMEFDAAEWDRQMEADSENGRLNRLAKNALEEHRAGKTTLI